MIVKNTKKIAIMVSIYKLKPIKLDELFDTMTKKRLLKKSSLKNKLSSELNSFESNNGWCTTIFQILINRYAVVFYEFLF